MQITDVRIRKVEKESKMKPILRMWMKRISLMSEMPMRVIFMI
jgi:DNA-binding cell septation regulator SpoVG